MLSAVPDTTWSAFSVTEANACNAARPAPATTAAMTPSHVLPVASATAVPANAPVSIMPSSAMLTMPLRSQIVPPMAASASGVAMRIADAKRSGLRTSLSTGRHRLLPGADEPVHDRLGRHEEDHEPLDDPDDLARHVRFQLH